MAGSPALAPCCRQRDRRPSEAEEAFRRLVARGMAHTVSARERASMSGAVEQVRHLVAAYRRFIKSSYRLADPRLRARRHRTASKRGTGTSTTHATSSIAL